MRRFALPHQHFAGRGAHRFQVGCQSGKFGGGNEGKHLGRVIGVDGGAADAVVGDGALGIRCHPQTKNATCGRGFDRSTT